MYNQLIDHIDDHCCQIQLKTILWKQELIAALKAYEEKLKDYYKDS